MICIGAATRARCRSTPPPTTSIRSQSSARTALSKRLAFSGYLTYRELLAETGASCPSPGEPGTVFGYPACVYGFFMYLAIVIAAVLGLGRTRARSQP